MEEPWEFTCHAVGDARGAVLGGLDVRGQRRHVLALFDGTGAPVAADALAAEAVHGPGHVLAGLNQHVLADGSTAAAMALFLPDAPDVDAAMACVGDIALFTLTAAGHLKRTSPQDGMGHTLTDSLGRPDMRGHVLPLSLGEAPVLLCTYSIEHAVDPFLLEQLLSAPSGVRDTALELVFDAANDAGVDGAVVLGIRP